MKDPGHASRGVRGYCALCTAHCATIATVTDGKVVRLDADPDHPNGGVFCIKGKAAPELVYHPDRLNFPLKRTRPKNDSDPGWKRISWDEALDDIAARLNSVRETYGPRAMALAKGTGGGTSVSDAERWLSRFINRFGSPNWVSTTHVCNWHKDTGFTYTFGVEIPTPDLAHSNAFLLWGHNPSSTSLVLAHDIVAARKRGMKIVAVDPRRVGIAGQADVLLQVRPGSDGALALALIDVVITDKLYDETFVRQWTNAPLLVRVDNGNVLTESDLITDGSSQTAALCDYVLPATSFLEMGNLTTDFKHRPQGKLHVQYRPPVVAPLAERRSDTWIVFELAKRLGFGRDFWDGDVEAAYAHELATTGLSLNQVKASAGGITLSAAPRYRKYSARTEQDAPRGFNTPDKRVELYSHSFAAHGFPPLPEYQEPLVSPVSRPDIAADYPLVLTNAKFTTYIHSQLRGLSSLRKASPEPTADIHPDTAKPYGIKDKQWMIVESPRGSIRAKARVTDAITPGVVCCQHGWWQDCKDLKLSGYDAYGKASANPGLLIGSDLADPISGSLPHRSYLCRVRPAE
jgi:anaerobic selenocysteine-containing dehydrogenase